MYYFSLKSLSCDLVHFWISKYSNLVVCVFAYLGIVYLVVRSFWTRNWSCYGKARILLWKKGKYIEQWITGAAGQLTLTWFPWLVVLLSVYLSFSPLIFSFIIPFPVYISPTSSVLLWKAFVYNSTGRYLLDISKSVRKLTLMTNFTLIVRMRILFHTNISCHYIKYLFQFKKILAVHLLWYDI